MLSVLILTCNEQLNLPRCLQSVAWSDDIVVLDSFSTDQTLKIAKHWGAKVLQNRFTNFAEQRNFGLAHGGFKNDWVLHLDADEAATPELKDEILSTLQHPDKDAYRIASKMMFMGKWLKHSGLYPWHQVRLGKREQLAFIQTGHGQRENLPPEQLGTLKQPIVHYSFSKGIAEWFERHNRYSTAEAEHVCTTCQALDWGGLVSLKDITRRHRAMKVLFYHLPFRPALRFLYMYVGRLGFLDGRAGLTYCRLLCIYEYLLLLKSREIRQRQSGEVGLGSHWD